MSDDFDVRHTSIYVRHTSVCRVPAQEVITETSDKLKCVGHQGSDIKRIGSLRVAGTWKPASEGESAGGLPKSKYEG